MEKVELSRKLEEIERTGDFAELHNLIHGLPKNLQEHPASALKISRLLLMQGEFNLASEALAKFDSEAAEASEKLIAELQNLQTGIYRNQVRIGEAGKKVEKLLETASAAQLTVSESARAGHLAAQIFLIGCLYSEFPPEKRSEARKILETGIEELEQAELFDQALRLRFSYSDSLEDSEQRLRELLKISARAIEMGDLAATGKSFSARTLIMLQNGFSSAEIYRMLAEAEQNFTNARHVYGTIETQHIRAKLQIERERASPQILLPVIEGFRTARYTRGELSALMDIIHLFHENGDLGSASGFQRTLVDRAKKSGFLLFLFNVNLQFADVLIRNGNFRRAIELCEETLAMPKVPSMTAATYHQLLGTAYFFVGNFEKSDLYYTLARRTFEKINQPESASNLAILQVNNLDSLRRDELWDRAEEILTAEIGKNRTSENRELAIRLYEQLVQIKLNRFSFSPTRRGAAALLPEAEAIIIEAERQLSKLPARKSALRRGGLLQLRGQLAYQRGNNAEVVKCWNEAAEAFASAGFEYEAANSQFMIGLIFHNLANQKILPNALISQEALLKAIDYYNQAAMRLQAADAHYHLAHLYKNAMAILSVSSESADELVPQTLIHITKAEEIFDSVRRDFYTFDAVEAQQGKQTIIEKSSRLYQLGLELYLQKTGDRAATWNWLQRVKARGLTDLLAGSFIEPAKLLSEISAYPEALEAVRRERELKMRLRSAPADQVSALRGELAELQKSMDSEPVLQNYLDIRAGNPVTSRDLERISTDEKGSSCVFIDWINTGKNLYLACLRPGSAPEFIPLDIELTRVEEFYQSWLSDESFRSTLSEDYELLDELNPLIAPLAELTEPEELLVLAPTGILFSLPLHALKIRKEYLIDRNPVIYEPSLSILNQCYARRREPVAEQRFAVFGDPDTDRAAALEAAKHLAERYQAILFTGKNVTLEAFAAQAKEKDVIHFQGHAVFNAASPLDSYLKFADGRLDVRAVFSKLNFDAELVSLMACESGVNRINTGDELLGLIPALIYAGARSVFSTLWRVNEDSAAAAAKLFYAQLDVSSPEADKARALRRAILELKKNERFSVPYYWAGYVLYGDWY